MDNKEYESLVDMGFDSRQINQLEKLSEYIPVSRMMSILDFTIDVDYLRNANYILNKNHDPTTVNYMQSLLISNIDPGIYPVDLFNTADIKKQDFVHFVIRETINKKNSGDNINYDLGKFIQDIEKCNLTDFKILNDYVINNNPYSVFSPEFNNEQIKFADTLYKNGCFQYIKSIPEFSRFPDLNKNVYSYIDENNMDFVGLVNNYSDNDITSIAYLRSEDIDVDKFLRDKDNPKQVYLCASLIKLNYDEKIINEILKNAHFKYFYEKTKLDVVEKYVDLKLQYPDVDDLFEKFPSEDYLMISKLMLDNDYSHSDIKNFYEYITSYYHFSEDLSFLDEKTILKYLELSKENYDISNFISKKLQSSDIDILIKSADKFNIDLDAIFDRKFEKYEIDLMKYCENVDRNDIWEALIQVTKPDKEAYNYIYDILFRDEKYKTHHDIVNLLYDKGNDTFQDFDDGYEFNCRQKRELAEIIYDEILDDKQIDVIRDNQIDSEFMYELAEMASKNYDISGILKKIDILMPSDLDIIKRCFELGFNVIDNDIGSDKDGR